MARNKDALYWAPRVIGLVFAAFLCFFVTDAFVGNYTAFELLMSVILHLLPAAAVLLVLAFAWHWEWVGAVFYGCMGALYLYQAWEKFSLTVYLAISGPLFLLSLLFWLDWRRRGGAGARENKDGKP